MADTIHTATLNVRAEAAREAVETAVTIMFDEQHLSVQEIATALAAKLMQLEKILHAARPTVGRSHT